MLRSTVGAKLVVSYSLLGFLAFSTSVPNSQLDQIYSRAYALFKSGSYKQSAEAFEQGAHAAELQKDADRAMRFWNGAGGSHHSIGRYPEALTDYNRAIAAAQQAHLVEPAGAISLNVATVYIFLGDLDAAELSLRDARAFLGPNSKYIPQLLLQEGQIHGKRGDFTKAEATTVQAIETASLLGLASESVGWEKLGWILLTEKRVPAADIAFTEAYRLSQMQRGEIPAAVYQGLARVRLAQGDPLQAKRLLDTAIEIGTRRANSTPLWYLYQARGRALESSGNLTAALADYRKAIELARLWRSGVLPASWMQTATDAGVSSLSADLVALAQRLGPQQPGLSEEAFVEVEDSKANSLRLLMLTGSRIPAERKAEYGELRTRLSDALFRSMQTGASIESPEVRELRARLAVFESEATSSAGLINPENDKPYAVRLRDVRSRLGPNRVLLSFHVGEASSAMWVVSADTFRLISLPGRQRLDELVQMELAAIREGGPDKSPAFSALFFELLPRSILAKPNWVLSLDGALFNIPWAALRIPNGTGQRYLIEGQSLQIVPSALFLSVPRSGSPGQKVQPGRLVAVADPIYNRADPRWTTRSASLASNALTMREPGGVPSATPKPFELARLVATAWEVEAVRKATAGWVSEMSVLSGDQASPEVLARALARPVSVLHFATHVIASPQRGGTLLLSPEVESPDSARGAATVRPSEVLIALSMDGDQKIKFLSISEIISANYQLSGSLVVLNGCSSGVGAVLPGAGLLGLSRAWMTAGARAVVASRWPTLDEEGRFFEAFYRELGDPEKGTSSSVARALSESQRKMLRGGGWRSEPRFWATYFSVGRDYFINVGNL